MGLARQSHLADPELLFVHIYQNARQLPKMPRQLVNRDEQGRLIAQTSGAITMIDDSHYEVRSMSSDNTYTVTATQRRYLIAWSYLLTLANWQ